jgi:hypothetical protein
MDTVCTGWKAWKLNHLQFLLVAKDDALAFVDPSCVLRSCHIIPAFAEGRCHVDGKGLSSLGQDSSDWTVYYVNR